MYTLQPARAERSASTSLSRTIIGPFVTTPAAEATVSHPRVLVLAEDEAQATVVETYISYLRKKIDRLGPPLIHTVRGVGYTLRAG